MLANSWSSRLVALPIGKTIDCFFMARKPDTSEAKGRSFRTTGLHLPEEHWVLLNRVAFERARTKGGRASVSALLVELVDRHKRELEKELASASR